MSFPIPPSALQKLPQIHTKNLALISAFESHPQFAAQQTRRSGKIYFMWDFAQRTNAMLESIMHNHPPPDTPATRHTIPNVPPARMDEGKRLELKEDAVGRCYMLHMLITDTTGKTAIMFQEAPGQEVDVGDSVRSVDRDINNLIFGEKEEAATGLASAS